MKIDNFTFGQLYKLTCPANRLRIIKAYHSALRREWNKRWRYGFVIAEAAEVFPWIRNPWCRLLDFLADRRHRITLRGLADLERVKTQPGYWRMVRRVKYSEFGTAYQTKAYRLACLIQIWLFELGVVGKILETATGYEIWAEVDELNSLVLWHKSGPSFEYLGRHACIMGSLPQDLFPWIPLATDPQARINPLRRPVNTPDILDEINEIVVRPN